MSEPSDKSTIPTRSKAIRFIFDNSLLLLAGTAAGVVWANLAVASYDGVAHPLHFWIDDVGMVFFFALAAKEVFEATLPGGSLASPRCAAVGSGSWRHGRAGFDLCSAGFDSWRRRADPRMGHTVRDRYRVFSDGGDSGGLLSWSLRMSSTDTQSYEIESWTTIGSFVSSLAGRRTRVGPSPTRFRPGCPGLALSRPLRCHARGHPSVPAAGTNWPRRTSVASTLQIPAPRAAMNRNTKQKSAASSPSF
jgi:hypothetical protein